MAIDHPGGKDSPAPIRVHLLGTFAATAHGSPVSAPPLRVQALLAALLLHPRPLRRPRLGGLLYPEASERQARKWLSHALWQARHWLPDLPVEALTSTVYLPAGAVWHDVEPFKKAARGEALGDWLQALALYRGDLLEGIYDDWLLEEREAIYLAYVGLSHRACDALWRQGRVEELLPVAERLVQREPYDERALRTLMRAYQALGRRGAALAAYERCVRVLQAEIGAEVEPATVALAQAVRDSASIRRGHPSSEVACAPEGGAAAGHQADVASLLDQAQKALLRGDVAAVRDLIHTLRLHPSCDPHDLRLLLVDDALFREDFDRAAVHLGPVERASLTPAEKLRAAQIALGRHNAAEAQELAAEHLVTVAEAGDRSDVIAEMSVVALLTLSQAQLQLGQQGDASQTAERALTLARQAGFHHGVAQALMLQGLGRLRQGRYGGAGACFREARAIALERGLRHDLASALRGLRVVLCHTNALGQALTTVEEELSLWRDMELVHGEAAALEGMATIQNHLGLSAESLRTLAQAQALSDRRGDPVRMATHRYHLASAMIYHDDALARDAIEVAREALAMLRKHHEPGWEAASLEVIGYALWVDGQHAAALDVLREAEVLTRRLGELAFLPELLAYQGLAQVGLGRTDEALDLTRQAVLLQMQGGVSDEVVPEILYARAMALATAGLGAEAEGYLTRAYSLLLDGASALQDEAARLAFFHRNPTMRRLMRELEIRGIVPPSCTGVRSVQLSAARGGGSLRVTWTVDAGPPDGALRRADGAIALRRARLTRLLAEARAQGGTPTVADLARALDVSPRTIQRDLATLRH